MEFLPVKLETALDLADADPEQAAIVLRLSADYLRKGEPLPFPLALFLADAFERAMRKAPSVRGSELLINLKLKAHNKRRLAVNFEHLGRDFEKCLESNMTVIEARNEVGDQYGISDTSVKRIYEKYLDFMAIELEKDAALNEEKQLDMNRKEKKSRKVLTKKS